jgi:enamine deaminase RidA (YjgF/YER057c/UK114 family)
MAIIQTLHSVFPNHRPLWTAVGVKALAAPEALIEIRAMAHIPAPSSS